MTAVVPGLHDGQGLEPPVELRVTAFICTELLGLSKFIIALVI